MSSHTTEEERRRKIIIDSQVAAAASEGIQHAANDTLTADQIKALIATDEEYLSIVENIMRNGGPNESVSRQSSGRTSFSHESFPPRSMQDIKDVLGAIETHAGELTGPERSRLWARLSEIAGKLSEVHALRVEQKKRNDNLVW